MNIKKFEKDMAAFSFSQHQTFVTYYKHLMLNDWTVEEAISWVTNKIIRDKKQHERARRFHEARKLICPNCSKRMIIYPINFSSATLTGDDSKSVWLCSNKDCMHTIYNKESVEELRSKGGK